MAAIAENTIFTAPRRDCDVEQTVRRSRFIGSVRTALTVEAANGLIRGLPALFPKASSYCWAYKIGQDEHCTDGGEPSGTAGRPILGVIKRHGFDNTFIAVTRYFGGVKLGVRGLIDAFGAAAEAAAEEAGAAEMEYYNRLELACGYDYSKTLSSTLRKWGFGEDRQNAVYGADVALTLEVPCSMRQELTPELEEMKARGFLTKLAWCEGNEVFERFRKK